MVERGRARAIPGGALARFSVRCRGACSVLSPAVRRDPLRSGQRRIVGRSRAHPASRQAADPREHPDISDRMTPYAQALQHRRLERRAADLLHGQGSHQPRCRGEVARDPLVGRGHRRPGDRGLGLADRARRPGSPPTDPGSAAAHEAAAGVRDVRREARQVRRGDSGDAATNGFRLSLRACAHRTPCRRPGTAPGRPRNQGGIRDVGAAVRSPASANRKNVRLRRRQRLRRPRRRIHRARVSGGRNAHFGRGHRRRDRQSRGRSPACRRVRRNRRDPPRNPRVSVHSLSNRRHRPPAQRSLPLRTRVADARRRFRDEAPTSSSPRTGQSCTASR